MSESLTNGWDEEADEADDLTAGDVFDRLRSAETATSADSESVYSELVDEEPEELVAAADEPTDEPTPEDDDILADDDALDSLLLSDRTEADGFLWVDAESAVETDDGVDDETDESPSIVDDWMIDFAIESDDDADPVDQDAEAATPDAAEETETAPLPIVDEEPEAIALSKDSDESADSNRGLAGRLIGRVKRLVRGLF
jgi:hypothetical protein